MTNRTEGMEALLTQLEDELLASTDEDILASPDAGEVSQRVASLVEGRLQSRFKRVALPAKVPGRRDRRGHLQERQRLSKRQLVDRVLVASPKAQALVEPDKVAIMSEDELDYILVRMRALGLLGADD